MSTTVQQVPTETYNVDPVHSTIGFGVKYNGLATFRSTFEAFDAKLENGQLTGSAHVTSIQIDEPNFKGHLLSEEFFNAEATPTITFRSTDIRPAEDGSVEVDGELTIRGVTKPVVATGTHAAGADPYGNERVAFELQAKIDRREFGLNWQNALPTGADALAWDVTLNVDLQLVKA
jgi:polyisoprenoid-binding protein YceI